MVVDACVVVGACVVVVVSMVVVGACVVVADVSDVEDAAENCHITSYLMDSITIANMAPPATITETMMERTLEVILNGVAIVFQKLDRRL